MFKIQFSLNVLFLKDDNFTTSDKTCLYCQTMMYFDRICVIDRQCTEIIFKTCRTSTYTTECKF